MVLFIFPTFLTLFKISVFEFEINYPRLAVGLDGSTNRIERQVGIVHWPPPTTTRYFDPEPSQLYYCIIYTSVFSRFFCSSSVSRFIPCCIKNNFYEIILYMRNSLDFLRFSKTPGDVQEYLRISYVHLNILEEFLRIHEDVLHLRNYQKFMVPFDSF